MVRSGYIRRVVCWTAFWVVCSLSSVLAAGPKYLIFGEDHYDGQGHNMFKSQLQYLKSQGYTTLAVETWQPEMAQSVYGGRIPAGVYYNAQSDPGTLRLLSLTSEARAMGMDIKFIDMPESVYENYYSGQSPTDPLMMHQRNKYMAEQLAEIPGKTVVLTGTAHIGENNPYGNSIDELLEQKGYTTATIGLSVPSKDYFAQLTGSWSSLNGYDPTDYGQFYGWQNWTMPSDSQLRNYINSALAAYPDTDVYYEPAPEPAPSQPAYFAGYGYHRSNSSPHRSYRQGFSTEDRPFRSPPRRVSHGAQERNSGFPEDMRILVMKRVFSFIRQYFSRSFPSPRGNIIVSVNP